MSKRVLNVPALVWMPVLILALWGLGVASGLFAMPGQKALAQQCVNQECIDEPVFVCSNLGSELTEVPAGYHIDRTQNNACVADPPPQVLGASTTVTPTPDPAPQVLAATTGK